eukprot:UN31384
MTKETQNMIKSMLENDRALQENMTKNHFDSIKIVLDSAMNEMNSHQKDTTTLLKQNMKSCIDYFEQIVNRLNKHIKSNGMDNDIEQYLERINDLTTKIYVEFSSGNKNKNDREYGRRYSNGLSQELEFLKNDIRKKDDTRREKQMKSEMKIHKDMV